MLINTINKYFVEQIQKLVIKFNKMKILTISVRCTLAGTHEDFL